MHRTEHTSNPIFTGGTINIDDRFQYYTTDRTGTITVGNLLNQFSSLLIKKRIPLEHLDKTIAENTKGDSTTKELIIRQGEALEVQNPLNVNIDGNIDAPSRFVEKRETKPETSICYFSTTKGEIQLITDDREPFGKYIVTGKIKINPKYKALGINNADVTLPPKALARKFKMLRRMFPSKEEHMRICNILNKFEAKVHKEFEESQSDNGDYKSLKNQIVESNIPSSFLMSVPIIEGEDETTIEVFTVIVAEGNTIKCSLESVDAIEYIEDFFDKRVKDEVKKLEGKTTLISR